MSFFKNLTETEPKKIIYFWTVWFLKTESELNFGFPHIPTANYSILVQFGLQPAEHPSPTNFCPNDSGVLVKKCPFHLNLAWQLDPLLSVAIT